MTEKDFLKVFTLSTRNTIDRDWNENKETAKAPDKKPRKSSGSGATQKEPKKDDRGSASKTPAKGQKSSGQISRDSGKTGLSQPSAAATKTATTRTSGSSVAPSEVVYKPKELRELESKAARMAQGDKDVDEEDEEIDDDDNVKEPEELEPDQEESANVSIDLMEHNALGYRYQTYQTGGPWSNAFMIVWDLCFLALSVNGILAGYYLKLKASQWVILAVQNNEYYKYFKELITVVDPNTQEIEFTDLIPEIAERLIIYHSIYAACALGYMSYALHKYQFTVPTFAIVGCMVTFAEVTSINVTYEPDQAARDFVETLSAKTKASYSVQSNDTHSISLDYISLLFQCCGIADHYDFQGLVLHYESDAYGGRRSVVVPPSCCKYDAFRTSDALADCTIKNTDMNKDGCFNIFIKKIQEYCEWYSIITWLHLADLALHGAIYKMRLDFFTRTLIFKSERQDAQMRHILRKRLVHEAMMIKKLVAISRLSNN